MRNRRLQERYTLVEPWIGQMMVNESVVVEVMGRDEAVVLNRLRLQPSERIVLDVNKGGWSARLEGRVRSCRPSLEKETYRCHLALAGPPGEDEGEDVSTERRPLPFIPFSADGSGFLNANLERSVPIQILNVSQAGCLLASRERMASRMTGELQVKAGGALCGDAAYVVRCESAGGTQWPFVVGVELLPTRRIGPGTLRGVIGTATRNGGWLQSV